MSYKIYKLFKIKDVEQQSGIIDRCFSFKGTSAFFPFSIFCVFI